MSVAAVSGTGGALGWRERVEQKAYSSPSGLDRSLCGFAEQQFEFDEDLLDGVEVGAVGGSKSSVAPAARIAWRGGLAFMAGEVIEGNDIAGLDHRHETLLDPGGEGLAVDRPSEHVGRGDEQHAAAKAGVMVHQRPCGMRLISFLPPGHHGSEPC